jgi:farnesyl diphosphate synthase
MIDQAKQNFTMKLQNTAKLIEQELKTVLSEDILQGEIVRPDHLMQAMRHGSLNGGKRLRPFLVLETAKSFNGSSVAALKVATALECIHCYSLVHDDLPAMDDDALRRGQPTVHIAFDEATAILAGDGLLTYAFDILSADTTPLSAEKKIKLISSLTRASGLGGMVGGQALDLAAEKTAPDEAGILTLQQMKTGALIRYACEAGAKIGDADNFEHETMSNFGRIIGQAFQLADDLLDVTSDAKTMGKNTGKDADRGKATLVALHGADWARAKLVELAEEAKTLLHGMNRDTKILEETANFVIFRDR